ncbi:LysR family transcriptional regulator [Phenylobacterium sp.]|uniref:LysR family transcriptional regulator n=1 Tax=Phenylobacterium sp. TaxID=1871053 RepID=UPI0030F3E26A
MSDIGFQNIRKLDGGLLLVFRELMRQGRATAAAERLGLSQSGVSHALARLREVFGDPLFIRRPHGLEPTRRALELAPRIEALIDAAQDLVGGAPAFEPAHSERQFHIGAADFVAALLAAPLLAAVQAEAPRAAISFRFAVGDAALDALRRGEVDLALGRFAKLPEPLKRERILRGCYAVAGRAGHPAFEGGLTLQKFAELGHIMVGAGATPAAPLADAVLTELGVKRRVVAHTTQFMTAFTIAAATDAVVTAPAPLAERYARAFGLEVVTTPFPSPVLEVFAVHRIGASPDPALPWLLAQVRRAAA